MENQSEQTNNQQNLNTGQVQNIPKRKRTRKRRTRNNTSNIVSSFIARSTYNTNTLIHPTMTIPKIRGQLPRGQQVRPISATIQVPIHHKTQDEIFDLTDDNAPKNPMAGQLKVTNSSKNSDATKSGENINTNTEKKKFDEIFKKKQEIEGALQKRIHTQSNIILNLTEEDKNITQKGIQMQMSETCTDEIGAKYISFDDNNTSVQSEENKDKRIKMENLLEGLPSEIKLVVQDKLKAMKVVKQPIIMPKIEEPVEENQPKIVFPKPIYCGKPIEVRLQDKVPPIVKVENVEQRPPLLGGKPIEVRLQDKALPNVKVSNVEQKPPLLANVPLVSQKRKTHLLPNPTGLLATASYPKGIPRTFLMQQQVQNSDSLYSTEPIWPTHYSPQGGQSNDTKFYEDVVDCDFNKNSQIQTDLYTTESQRYSPTDAYDESVATSQDSQDATDSPNASQTDRKRVSAFDRLGPVAETKKPKLTINLSFNKEQAVREVVNETPNPIVPVHLRPEVQASKDEIVKKYLNQWPWKNKVTLKKVLTARSSRSVMIIEQEQMIELYEKNYMFFQISITGYPPSWTKENVLDVLLENIQGKSLIPTLIDFTPEECRFLVLRATSALLAIHKLGFVIKKGNVQLLLSIACTDLILSDIELIPRLVLRQKLASGYDEEALKLNLREFTLQPDISHFIYYPLNRVSNQSQLTQQQSVVAWDVLAELDLSHNRLTTIEGFNLALTAPRLKHLDLSYNYIEGITDLLKCRGLLLHSIKLEGNPLCLNYIDSDRYVNILKMIFPTLKEIDGVAIRVKGEIPPMKQNYCPEDAKIIVEKFLEIYFPLLELPPGDRMAIQEIYDDKAVLTLSCKYKSGYNAVYRQYRSLFVRCRSLEQGEVDAIEGAVTITKHISKWPTLLHDLSTATVDVLHHGNTSTILQINGILKVKNDGLAEAHILTFNRTVVLKTRNGIDYKIINEMLCWDVPTEECVKMAFKNVIQSKHVNIKQLFENPDDDLKEKLVEVFVKLTNLDKDLSKKCLQLKDWDFKTALEHFIKLLKLDNVDTLKTVFSAN